MVISKTCNYCKKTFERPKNYSLRQWENRKTCSRSCASKKISKDQNDRIIRLYAAGLSCKEISKSVELTKESVARIIRKAGITREHGERVSMGLNKPEVRTKLSAIRAGKTLSEEAKEKLRSYTGDKNANWRAGLTKTSGGYLQFTASPANGIHANRLVHQVIAEWTIGRKIKSGEHVHHIDGNKLNNSPENLQVLTAREHAILHNDDRKKGLSRWRNH